MNITYWFILLTIISLIIALYFDLRKKDTGSELVNINVKEFINFFDELNKFKNNNSFLPSNSIIMLTKEERSQIEKRFLEDIELSKKYKVNYEIEKENNFYSTFDLYKNYSKKEKNKAIEFKPKLIEFKPKLIEFKPKLIEFKPTKNIFEKQIMEIINEK